MSGDLFLLVDVTRPADGSTVSGRARAANPLATRCLESAGSNGPLSLADGVRAATGNSLPAVFARSTVGQWVRCHADGLIAGAWLVGSMGCLFLGAWWSGR